MAKLTYADIIANDRRFTAIADRAEQLDRIDAAALMTRLVDLVEPEHLILLADALHVMGEEGWNYADTDEQKRNLIKMAIPLHRRKGTPWAVKQLLENYGLLDKTQMVEWWQPHPLPRAQPPKTVDLITDAATAPAVVRVLPSLEQTKPAGTVLRPVTLQQAALDDVPIMLMLGMATIRGDAAAEDNVRLNNVPVMGVFAQAKSEQPFAKLVIPKSRGGVMFSANYSLISSRQAIFPMLSRRV